MLFVKDMLMRIHPSAVLLWGCAVAATFGPTADAQDFDERTVPAASAGFEDAADEAARPGVVRLTGGQVEIPPAAAPPDAQPYPDGYPPPVYPEYGYPPAAPPPGMAAWPGTSPFEHSFDETYNQRGMWYNESNNETRDYNFSLDYIRTFFRQPGTDTVGDYAFNSPLDPINGAILPAYDVSTINNLDGNGLRGKFVAHNPDDTSLEIQAWFGTQVEDTFSPLFDVKGDLNDPSTVRPRASIPLDDGFGGVNIPFDTSYKLTYKVESFGGDLDWYTMSLYRSSVVNVRGLVGAKFLRIGESFSFQGSDSGLGVLFAPNGTPIDLVDLGVPPYESYLNSNTKSYLAGPEIGLRYEMGGKLLKLGGQTKFAVAVNSETITINGNNMDSPFVFPFPTPTPTVPYPMAFTSTQKHTHVSPIIDQSVYAEAPLFGLLPVIGKSPLLKGAKLRVGYTFILVNEVARPTQVIRWVAPAPAIELTRTRWSVGMVNVGINWKF